MNNNKGFSLIEVLVSLLILSIGLLGMAALMLQGLKQESGAIIMTQALQSGESLIERIRTLPDENYIVDYGEIPSRTDCETRSCTPEGLRDYYIYEWKCMLGGYEEQCNVDQSAVILPEGDAKIESNNGLITITFKWSDRASVNQKEWEIQSYE